ncbi:MAG: hypothetical protein SFW67_28705 [Myxococcaceae bacterium]|nr:hypothetical protein [Myxococcaceae bacterium]
MAVALALLAGCRCGPDVNQVEQRFRLASTDPLDFGRVLEGTVVTKSVTLIAETRVAVSVAAAAPRPFLVERLVDIPGGSQVELEVSFRAENGESTGELTLTSGRQEVRLALRGVGVRKPPCIPSGVCRVSEYSLELDRCVETVAPDEALCEPQSQCLEQGRCRAGQCLGVARRCNDNDACTSDACAMDAGCVHTRITCPPPTMPCRVATCDARTGCGDAVAADGTPCGRSDCVSARVCVMGECKEIATPEGTECGPAIACYGVSRCQNQRCARPDAGPWEATWTARLDGRPAETPPGLVSFGGAVYLTQCGVPLVVDGGAGDGGLLDAGTGDGGDGDAGLMDGGDGDAGPATTCVVRSYTGTGFERFTEAVVTQERLAHVSPAGVVLLVDGGFVFRTRSMGRFVAGWEADGLEPTQVASLSDGGVVVAVRRDGGAAVVLASATVTSTLAAFSEPVTHLAVDEADRIVTLGEGVLRRLAALDDGGLLIEQTVVRDAGFEALALAGDTLVVGTQLVRFEADGGASAVGLAEPPVATWRPREVLVTPSTVFLFFKACTVMAMSCLPTDAATWVRAYERTSGVLLWEDTLLPTGLEGRLVEVAALRLPGSFEAALAAVVEETRDGGAVRGGLVVSLDGGRLECPFPEGTGRVASAVFTPGQLLTLATRPDGGVVLEAWQLGPLPLELSGWPQSGGLSSQRRAVP